MPNTIASWTSSQARLLIDHHRFEEKILDKRAAAIFKTRDGKLSAAVPNPIGSCASMNDVDAKELNAALLRHKKIIREYPRNEEGIEDFISASNTRYTDNHQKEVKAVEVAAAKTGSLNGNGSVHGRSVPNDYLNDQNRLVEKLAHENGVDTGLTSDANGFMNGARG